MNYLSAGVVLIIVGILVYLFAVAPTIGVIVGVVGAGLILYALLARR